EQAIVRLVIATTLFFYLLPEAFDLAGGKFNPGHPFFVGMVVQVLFSAAVLACIIAWPGVSPTRRLISAANDIGSLTYFMSLAGAYAMPLYLIYIWVTLANGFRFGANYLLFCLALSVIGMVVVLFNNDYLQANHGVWVGLVIGMVALAIYVRSLVTRMFDALA